MNREERKQLADYILNSPSKSYHVIANEKAVSVATVGRIAQEFSIKRPTGPKTSFIIAATPTTATPEVQ
jgi:uncharacterized protein YerC